MIKHKLSLFALVALGVVAFATPSQAATYNAGDLILGFRVTGGTGSGSDLLVNLGSSTTYRDLSSNSLNLTNIATDLASTYGASWYDRTDLSFGIAGVFTNISLGNGGVNNNGDPGQTLYFSKSRLATGTEGSAQSSVQSNYSNTNFGTASGQMKSLGSTGYATATASSNNSRVAIVSSSGSSSWSTYTNPVSGLDFGVIDGVEQNFASGSWQGGTFGSVSNVEGVLDLYRYLQTTTGASPTGTAKTGLYLDSIVIDQSGNLSAIVTSAAVPEPSTFAMAGIAAIAAGFAAYRRKKVSAEK